MALVLGSGVASAQDYYPAYGVFSRAVQVTLSNLVVTSTDGEAITNQTPATVGVPVQISPRTKWCGTAFNSVGVVSETNCYFAEVLPTAAAGTTGGTFRLGYIAPNGAITYPMFINQAGNMTITGNFVGGTVDMGVLSFNSATRARMFSPADGQLVEMNAAQTVGTMIKVDALPTVSACGAGTPAVTAGSTPFAGSVTVGTGAPATCTITFNGTAYPSAPHCSGAVETSTAANVRAMGFLATTTALTIVPTAAWADSSIVNWSGCISAK